MCSSVRPEFSLKLKKITIISTKIAEIIKSDVLILLGVMAMVFNTTFNNISAISWRSVLLVEEIGGPGENHRPVASH
jgi:hypothetical protein